MGYMKRKTGFLIAVIMLLFYIECITVNADVVSDLEIEQVVTKMPEIKAYITGTGVTDLNAEKIQVYKEENLLTIQEIKKFQDTGEGIRYYLLLDISGSMTPEEFQAFKAAALTFVQQLQEQDEISIITFGDAVNILWNKNEGIGALNERLQTLSNDNMNTQLFEALSQVGDLCQQQADMTRKCAIILSDGVDDIKGMATENEAKQKLEEAGVPVYGIAVGDDNKEGVDRFGELVRGTGGELYLAQTETVGTQLSQLSERVKNAAVLYMKADNNVVSRGLETVRFEFLDLNLKKELQTGFYQWTPDNTQPEITEVTQIGKNQLEVNFSEPVTGLNESDNFELADVDGKETVPEGAASETANVVKLTFADNFIEGSYTLECHNIKDTSMETNPLKETTTEVSLTGEKPSKIKEFLKTWGWLGVLAGLVVLVIIILLIYRKIKKNKGVLVVDEKLTLASNVKNNVHQVVDVQEKEGVHMVISITSGHSDPVELQRDLYDSLIVGRSDICELCVADNRMSKQHFVIEYEEGDIYITDLDSTNGTMINGIRIGERQKLNNDDIVTAGNTDFRFRWEETE